jgi:glutamyl endopeptidase
MSRPLSMWSFTRRLILLILLTIALIAGAAGPSAQAQALQDGEDDASLHTVVSSDGVLPGKTNLAGDANIIQNEDGFTSRSARGTGKLVNSRKEILPILPGIGGGSAQNHGGDNRYQIDDTTEYPYRAVVLFKSSTGHCTGWLIGTDTVATAGHCVYDRSSNTWATDVIIYPGYNGDTVPFGSCNATRLYSVKGWTQNKDPKYDYGAVKLDCSIGDEVGWFGFRWQSASLTGTSTTITGYPEDKANDPSYTMWEDQDSVRQTAARQLFYDHYTVGGVSGSPVYHSYSDDCDPCSIAIHAYGPYEGSAYNRGTRIVQPVFNNLVNWKNAS